MASLLPQSSSSSPLLHPLDAFVELTWRRCADAIVESVRAVGGGDGEESSVASVAAVLSFSWFKEEWRRSGCAVLPLLHLRLQATAVQAQFDAASASASSPAASSLSRSCCLPADCMASFTAACCSRLLSRLVEARGEDGLARRLVLYFSIRAVHGSQLSRCSSPVPLPPAAWPVVAADLRLLSSLPTADGLQLLRLLLRRCFVPSAAYEARGEAAMAAGRRSSRHRQRHSSSSSSTLAQAPSGSDGSEGEDDDDGSVSASASASPSASRRRSASVSAFSSSLLEADELRRAEAQQRFDSLTAAVARSPQAASRSLSALPAACAASACAASASALTSPSLSLSAWLSSGRPLPLLPPLEPAWQRELEGTSPLRPSASSSAPPRLCRLRSSSAAYSQAVQAAADGSAACGLSPVLAELERSLQQQHRAVPLLASRAPLVAAAAVCAASVRLSLPALLSLLFGCSLAARLQSRIALSPAASARNRPCLLPPPVLQQLSSIDAAYSARLRQPPSDSFAAALTAACHRRSTAVVKEQQPSQPQLQQQQDAEAAAARLRQEEAGQEAEAEQRPQAVTEGKGEEEQGQSGGVQAVKAHKGGDCAAGEETVLLRPGARGCRPLPESKQRKRARDAAESDSAVAQLPAAAWSASASAVRPPASAAALSALQRRLELTARRVLRKT